MTDYTARIRNIRLRRLARRRGLMVTKSRTRDPGALDYGLYCMNRCADGERVSPAEGLTVDEVEHFLAQWHASRVDRGANR
jgi:hypothetical protein